MNERIQGLISAYLHRGSTPEQEQELFDACSRNPETAELLRQHLILSLKLHTLRDAVEVPTDLHHSLLGRINALEAETATHAARAPRTRATDTRAVPVATPGRFGWVHLFGTGLAGAAAVLLLSFWIDGADPDLTRRDVPVSPDTVTIVRTDTLTRIQEVARPVYLVRERAPALPADRIPGTGGQEEPTAGFAGQPTDDAAGSEGIAANVSNNNTLLSDSMPEESGPVIADISAGSSRVTKTRNFLAQYTSMLVSVESVSLSTKDRLY